MKRYLLLILVGLITACGGERQSETVPAPAQTQQHDQTATTKPEPPPSDPKPNDKTDEPKEWDYFDGLKFSFADFDIDVANKKFLKEEHALLKAVTDLNFINKYITAPTLESIQKDLVLGPTVVFLHMNKGKWQNPIVGEVKLVNDRRYQFIGQHPGDDYGIVVGVDNINQLVDTGFLGNMYYKLKLSKPWDATNEKEIGTGSYGMVHEVNFNGRQFVTKNNAFKPYSDKEIMAYEALLGVEGIGPYLGQIQNDLILLEKGEPLDTYAPAHQNMVIPFIKSLLKTMGNMHNRTIYHNDIKPNNIIVVRDIPHIIDFGNQSKSSWQLGRGHGFTFPYYAVGDMTGVKADLRALGFVFFAIKHFSNPVFVDAFYEPEKNVTQLKSKLKFTDVVPELKNGDLIDNIIAKMLLKEYSNAFEALAEIP